MEDEGREGGEVQYSTLGGREGGRGREGEDKVGLKSFFRQFPHLSSSHT